MNKEEMFELQKEKWKLNNDIFNLKKEYQETYKDVRIEIKDYKTKIKDIESQLDIANKKLDEIKEYVLENTYENPQYMDGISQLYDEKLNYILSIIGE